MYDLEITKPFKFIDSDGQVMMEVDPMGFGKSIPVGQTPLRIETLRAAKAFEAANELADVLKSPQIYCGRPDDPLPMISYQDVMYG